MDSGIFSLKTAAQLFQKLCRDYERVKRAPLDAEGWFNFMVTADHLPEWEMGANAKAAANLREREPLLRICNHLARNAKHFQAEDHRKRGGAVLLNAVAYTNEVQIVTVGQSLPVQTPSEPSDRAFTLQLSAREAGELGISEITALELGERVINFWRARLSQAPT